MASFSRKEIQFLKECCLTYKKDGFPLPVAGKYISHAEQDELINSALNKLSCVFLAEPLTRQEATLLCCALLHISKKNAVLDSDVEFWTLYHKLESLADPQQP